MEDPDGVDTLIMHLLADLGASQEAAAFAAGGTAAAVEELRPRLTGLGEGAALAHLAATAGHTEEALTLWRVCIHFAPLRPWPSSVLLRSLTVRIDSFELACDLGVFGFDLGRLPWEVCGIHASGPTLHQALYIV